MLAAANPIYGRYDDLKSAAENIDLMTTILSRFDLIFIVRDIRYERCDNLAICDTRRATPHRVVEHGSMPCLHILPG